MKNHIALVNPPARDFYSRAYFCSKVAKARYPEPVTDLVIISGNLDASGYDLSFSDGIAEQSSPQSVIERVKRDNPLAAVVMAGSASWSYDLDFIRRLKKEVGCTIIAIGDLFLENGGDYLEKHPEIDAVSLDFTENNIPPLLEKRFEAIRSMIYRSGDSIITAPRDFTRREYRIGRPRYDLFKKYPYHFPFSRRSPYAVLLSDYGCPFNCSFCIQRRGVHGFKLRPLDEVIRDLRCIHEVGFEEFWMADLTFGADKERTTALLERILAQDFLMPWWCLSRVDVLDEELLTLMKKAGCYLILLGLESASNDILQLYKKSFPKEKAIDTVRVCKKVGIETLATFIIGFPEDTRDSVEQLIDFAIDLEPDYASFNFATPKITTPLRESMLKAGLIDDDPFILDQTLRGQATLSLSGKEVMDLQRRAIRKFYLRPKYLLRKLAHPSSLGLLMRQGYYGIRTFFLE